VKFSRLKYYIIIVFFVRSLLAELAMPGLDTADSSIAGEQEVLFVPIKREV